MLRALRTDIREIFREQFEFREVLYQMTVRDLRLRYKDTVMGFGWAIFMPLINTAVFSVIFLRVAPIATPVAYPLFAYCGLMCWNFFAMSLKFSLTSLTSNFNLVSKVYFPREIFPFSVIVVSLIDFAVAGIVLAGMMIWYGIAPTPALLFLPVVVAFHLIFTGGIALLIAMGNLFFRDVKYLFEVVLTIWMFASSTLYPLDSVEGRLGTLMRLNPMTTIIDAYRAVLLYGTLPEPGPFIAVAAASLLIGLVSWIAFHRAEFRFAENL